MMLNSHRPQGLSSGGKHKLFRCRSFREWTRLVALLFFVYFREEVKFIVTVIRRVNRT